MSIPILIENQTPQSLATSSQRSFDNGEGRTSRVATDALNSSNPSGQEFHLEERACLVRNVKYIRTQRNNMRVLLRERTKDLEDANVKINAMALEHASDQNKIIELSESKNVLEQEKLGLEAGHRSLKNHKEQLEREKGQLIEDLNRSRQDCRDLESAFRVAEEEHRASSQVAVRSNAMLQTKVHQLEQNEAGFLREIEQLKAQLTSQNMSSTANAALRQGPIRSGPPSRK
jgi:chromosome segregation ATPase